MDETTSVTKPSAPPASSVMFSIDYLKSPAGILKMVQIVFGLICWAMAASVGDVWLCGNLAAYRFFMFTSVTSWLLTIMLLFVFLLGLNQTVGSTVPWAIVEFGFMVFWGLFYFIAACVQAAYICGSDTLLATSIFAYLITGAYETHAVLSYRAWKGNFPWQGGNTEHTVTT